MASTNKTDHWYLSLLGLSETFRTSNPPNIRLCIHCLQSVFNVKPPPIIEARTHLQLGNILFTHTKNIEQARHHLEKAWGLSGNISTFGDVHFEAASLLTQVYEKQNVVHMAKPVLRKAIEVSQQSPYWRCRLLFQLAQIHTAERDYVSACTLLGHGMDYATSAQSTYTKALFCLSKGMLLLIDKKMEEVNECLSLASHLIDTFSGTPLQGETLKVFFLVLQVCHYLMSGQVKSVKPALKQLQQTIQLIMQINTDDEPLSTNRVDLFHWLPKEHLCVLVYLITVMHSMQAGYMDKAQKYTDKALMQIEKLKMLDANPLLSSFQLMLLEHIIMCRLIMGNKSIAIHEIFQACHVCQQHQKLFTSHGGQLHTLLGLYAMSMNCMQAAEAQFKTALQLSQGNCLTTFIRLNLAMVYLRLNRHNDLTSLLGHCAPENLPVKSHSLKASAYFVQGLQAFFESRFPDAKRYLREALRMANEEDLNRLTSCSLVLLGHIFLSLGNHREAMNMVTPAMQLAAKIPDVHIQLWASSLLKDLYRLCGDVANEAEGFRMHNGFTQSLLSEHFQSSEMSEHNLIEWTEGACPFHLNTMEHVGTSNMI